MGAPQTEVVITVAGMESARFVLTPGDYVIGRDAGCPIRVEAGSVSRQHARLILNYDHALIEDLGGEGGTQVNGQPVAKGESTRLWPNQRIQVGLATITLRRLKHEASEMSLAPAAAMVKRALPEEFLRERKYDIGKVVAKGGMGAILDAREATTERTIAMKVMLDNADADALLRFLNEAKITAQLEHPNIVPVHELSVDENGQPYYTMKMVHGVTLKKVLAQLADGDLAAVKKYPLPALLTIFQKVCDALAFAHSKGVIHRDLKPENIMLGDYGEALVMDWGLAKRMKEEGGGMKEDAAAGEDIHTIRGTLSGRGAVGGGSAGQPSSSFDLQPSSFEATMVGTVLGTPQFMSPEQARGEVDGLDARSDIYSLGAILYQILTLRVPVTGKDAWEVVGKVGRGEIEPVERVAPSRVSDDASAAPAARSARGAARSTIPESLAAVVRKAMAFDRAARYASVAELQRDIAAYQTGFATSAEKAGAWKQFTLFVKRNKAASIGVVAVLLTGGVLGTKAIIEGRRAQRGEALAKSEATHAKNEAARAERGEAAAKATLADLRRTAPVFAAQAKVDFEEGNFDAAIEKIGYAIQLDDTAADYHLFRANLHQSSQDLTAAAEGYRRVLALRPADAAAKTNLALCETLLRETGGTPLGHPQQFVLLKTLREQKRLLEAAPLAALIDPDIKLAKAAILSRLREARKQPGWSDVYVSALPDGTFKVDLSRVGPIDVSVLKGQPVSELDLHDSGIADLSSLTGLPLKKLNLQGAKATDLSPLRGMPLEVLEANRTSVTDLSPLLGMPLKELNLRDAKKLTDLSPLRGLPLEVLNLMAVAASDLAPLRGMKLHTLDLRNTQISDLSPLAGAPLKCLNAGRTKVTDLTPLSQCPALEELAIYELPITDLAPLAKLHLTSLNCDATKITSIAPLRGQPLRQLNLARTAVTDLSPLDGCTTLEEIVVPTTATDLAELRKLPRLKLISTRSTTSGSHPTQTAEEFWNEYDAQQAGKK